MQLQLHQHLAALRRRCGMKIPEVMKRTGIARATLYDYESGACSPTPGRLGLLLRVYKASAGEQFDILKAYTAPPSSPDDDSEPESAAVHA